MDVPVILEYRTAPTPRVDAVIDEVVMELPSRVEKTTFRLSSVEAVKVELTRKEFTFTELPCNVENWRVEIDRFLPDALEKRSCFVVRRLDT